MRQRVFQRAFIGGEISPEMLGRIDDVSYSNGLQTCRNFIVRPSGSVQNRPGTEYVNTVKSPSLATRLIPFTYSTDQTMVIEVGEYYFRFHTQGATLLDGLGNPYEVTSQFVASELFDIQFIQSADVLTLVHPNHPPSELRRLGATNWQFSAINFGAAISTPSAPTVTYSGPASTDYTYTYAVTAVDADGNESPASGSSSVSGNLLLTGAKITVAFTAVTGAVEYRAYKQQGGIYGYIGSAYGSGAGSIVDDNIAPDLGRTPPLYKSYFSGYPNYPRTVTYYEQRRVFASTDADLQTIWMTKSGTESNLSYSVPLQDDDRIQFRIASREANTIRHMVPLNNLVLLTSSAEWSVSSTSGGPLTGSTVSAKPQSYVGVSKVAPVLINNTMIYAAARGGHMHELAYSWQANGYVTGDLSLRAAHLFDGLTVEQLAYSKAPFPVIWAISSSGALYGFTYIPEQKIGAWHRHDTDGVFESCAVVAEGGEDRLYAVVKRTINGVDTRYVERMSSAISQNLLDAKFVDSSLSYDGQPVSTVGNLTHLIGKTVSILTDGAVHPQRVVDSAGNLTLDYPASKIVIGLPITSDMKTVPAVFQTQDGGFGQGRPKNVNRVWLRTVSSSGVFVGPDFGNLTEFKQRTNEPYGSPPDPVTGVLEVDVTPQWSVDGAVAIRHTDPLPLTITSLLAEMTIGG